MIKRTFPFNNLTQSLKNDTEEKRFTKYSIPKLKIKDNFAGSYIFYFNNKIEKIQANIAYEAVKKSNFKNFNKMVYINKNSDIKNIFTKEELINNDKSI